MEGRIIKALAGYYYVLDQAEQVWTCRARGVFKNQGIHPLVGDWVTFDQVDEEEGWITEIKPRKNSLLRPPIANVDQALMVHASKEPAFNPLLLDRMLVLAEHSSVEPIICFTKVDLVDDWQELNKHLEIYEESGYKVLLTSPKTGQGIDQLLKDLEGKVTVLAGPSGVGKSTLINKVCPHAEAETGTVSKKLGRGRHTTRHVELLRLPTSGLVADSPGFSQLDFSHLSEEALGGTFPEIRAVHSQCKFRGCLHRSEPGCAVKEALSQNKIRAERYERYLQFLHEIEQSRERKRY